MKGAIHLDQSDSRKNNNEVSVALKEEPETYYFITLALSHLMLGVWKIFQALKEK